MYNENDINVRRHQKNAMIEVKTDLLKYSAKTVINL